MEYKTIDGTTYYKPSGKKSISPLVGIIAYAVLLGIVGGYLGSMFGLEALG